MSTNTATNINSILNLKKVNISPKLVIFSVQISTKYPLFRAKLIKKPSPNKKQALLPLIYRTTTCLKLCIYSTLSD